MFLELFTEKITSVGKKFLKDFDKIFEDQLGFYYDGEVTPIKGSFGGETFAYTSPENDLDKVLVTFNPDQIVVSIDTNKKMKDKISKVIIPLIRKYNGSSDQNQVVYTFSV